MRCLVTGAAGSIGRALVPRLRATGTAVVIPTDIADYAGHLDVTSDESVRLWLKEAGPFDVIFHLAGAKHAPEGEEDPAHVALVNITGTQNILRHAGQAKVVLASTCKACDPETAYGASKLIAERMVLNAGGVVVRYYNVRETSGNVFRLWESIPESEPIPFTSCWRYFISLEDAVSLTLDAATLPTGRYTVDPGPRQRMSLVAEELYPERELVEIPRRRGDRYAEPLVALSSERRVPHGRWMRIENVHDAFPSPQPAAPATWPRGEGRASREREAHLV